jgi:hypothetical protein
VAFREIPVVYTVGMLFSCAILGLALTPAVRWEDASTPPPPAPPSEDSETPVLTVIRESHDSLLSEGRRYGSVHDFPTAYEAVDVSGWIPMETTAALPILGKNAFWRAPDSARVAVDQHIFSALTVVDITSLDKQNPTSLGRLMASDADPSVVARLLIQADVIQTWIHIGSKLSVVSEGPTAAGGWRASFVGTHRYYTTEENVDPVAFQLEIDSTGLISVTSQ